MPDPPLEHAGVLDRVYGSKQRVLSLLVVVERVELAGTRLAQGGFPCKRASPRFHLNIITNAIVSAMTTETASKS